MPIRRKLKEKLKNFLGTDKPPHVSDYLPPQIRDKDLPSSPAHEFNNFVAIVGDQIGPDGETQGVYAVANGKSGDVNKFPLSADPYDPKAVFFPNGDTGLVRSIGGDTALVETEKGLYHIRRDNLNQLKPASERLNPNLKEAQHEDSSETQRALQRVKDFYVVSIDGKPSWMYADPKMAGRVHEALIRDMPDHDVTLGSARMPYQQFVDGDLPKTRDISPFSQVIDITPRSASVRVTAKTMRPPSSVPGVYYHGTSAENVPNILQHGLLADTGAKWAPAVAGDAALEGEKAVYLTSWLNQAIRYSIGIDKEQEPAVLEIHLDPALTQDDLMDDPREMRWPNKKNPWKPGQPMMRGQIQRTQFFYKGDIPPSAIKAVYIETRNTEDHPVPGTGYETIQAYEHARQLYFALKKFSEWGPEYPSGMFDAHIRDAVELAKQDLGDLEIDMSELEDFLDDVEHQYDEYRQDEPDEQNEGLLQQEALRIATELHEKLFEDKDVGYVELAETQGFERLTPEEYLARHHTASVRLGSLPDKLTHAITHAEKLSEESSPDCMSAFDAAATIADEFNLRDLAERLRARGDEHCTEKKAGIRVMADVFSGGSVTHKNVIPDAKAPYDVLPPMDLRQDMNNYQPQWIPVEKLTACQDSVAAERFEAAVASGKLPEVLPQADGTFMIDDGHHRTTKQVLDGAKEIQALVFQDPRKTAGVRLGSIRVTAREMTAFLKLAGPERINFLKEKNPAYAAAIDILGAADPSGGQQKYLDWALRQYMKTAPITSNELGMEPLVDDRALEGIKDALTKFHRFSKYLGTDKYSPELKAMSKDINQYKTVEALKEAMNGAEKKLTGILRVQDAEKQYVPKYGKSFAYAIREFARADPSGNQDYLDWALDQLTGFSGEVSHEMTEDELKNAIREISELYGRYHQLKQKSNVVEQITGSPLRPIDKYDTKSLVGLLDEMESVISESSNAPGVMAETSSYVAYGPITSQAQLCSVGSKNWCVARWASGHFEGDNYMGNPDGDPYFIMIESKSDESSKWLAFIRDNEIVEFNDDSNSPEDASNFSEIFDQLHLSAAETYVDIYWIECDGDIVQAADSRHRVENDLDAYVRGSGYEVVSGRASKSSWESYQDGYNANDLDIEEGSRNEVKRVDPETEERFYVTPFDGQNGPEDAYPDAIFETEDAARDWIEDDAGRLVDLAEEGWKLWYVDVNVGDLEDHSPRDWSMSETELLDEQEPGEDAAAAGDQLMTVYYLRQMVGDRPLGHFTSISDDETKVKRDDRGIAQGYMQGSIKKKDWSRSKKGKDLSYLNSPNVIQDEKMLQALPTEVVRARVIYADGIPVQVISESRGDDAGYDWFKALADGDFKYSKLEMRDVKVEKPRMHASTFKGWAQLDHVLDSTVVDSYEGKPPAPGMTEKMSVTEKILDQFPLGTIIKFPADGQKWAKSENAETGSIWASGAGGQDKNSSRFFPFAGAPMHDVEVTWGNGQPPGLFWDDPELAAAVDLASKADHQPMTARELYLLPLGTKIHVSGATQGIYTKVEAREWKPDSGKDMVRDTSLTGYSTALVHIISQPEPPKQDPHYGAPPELHLDALPPGSRIKHKETGTVWTKEGPPRPQDQYPDVQMWVNQNGRQIDQSVLQSDHESFDPIGQGPVPQRPAPGQMGLQLQRRESRVRLGSVRVRS